MNYRITIALFITIFVLLSSQSFAATSKKNSVTNKKISSKQNITSKIDLEKRKLVNQLQQTAAEKTSYSKRIQQEREATKNPFGIALYKPTYALPFYYTYSPDYAVYNNQTPENQTPKKLEFKAQISFKAPIWSRILHTNTWLDLAYTQLFYWQLYTKSPYFRETNYEPELFISHQFSNWLTTTAGIVHQSNGRGGSLERSWNRVYGEAIFSFGNLMVSLKPWVLIFKKGSSDLHNPDITSYLGHGRLLIAYKYHNQVLALRSANNIESGFRRGSAELSWSFPLFGHFYGFIQYFTGYGQSLIEYNHYTNSVGIGIALNNWI